MTTNMPLATFAIRAAMEARDVSAVLDTFAADARFHSPLTDRLTFVGHDQIALLIPVLFEVLEDFHYTAECSSGTTGFLVARARIGGQDLEIVDHLIFRADAKIEDFTAFFRPLPAAATALRVIGARLGRHKSGAYGALVATLSSPLAAMAKTGDRIGARLINAAL